MTRGIKRLKDQILKRRRAPELKKKGEILAAPTTLAPAQTPKVKIKSLKNKKSPVLFWAAECLWLPPGSHQEA